MPAYGLPTLHGARNLSLITTAFSASQPTRRGSSEDVDPRAQTQPRNPRRDDCACVIVRKRSPESPPWWLAFLMSAPSESSYPFARPLPSVGASVNLAAVLISATPHAVSQSPGTCRIRTVCSCTSSLATCCIRRAPAAFPSAVLQGGRAAPSLPPESTSLWRLPQCLDSGGIEARLTYLLE
ncbi:hypothetical protein C8R44DRAFT_987846 [Mycena epipterygia]|nr:hypothetical protein C8R44DRAFT_987846 [Mycena epipterygia]